MGWGEAREPLQPSEPVRWPVTQASRQLADAVRVWRSVPSVANELAVHAALDRFDAVAGPVGVIQIDGTLSPAAVVELKRRWRDDDD